MNDPDRDKFYSTPTPPPDDDDAEYELEAPDPTIVSAEQRHAKQVAEAVKVSIDIDDIYREADRNRGAEILEQWVRNFHFRFQTKHLLIATAVVAIALTLFKLGLFWPALVILVMLSVGGLYFYLTWEESKQRAEADRKRDELYARRREQQKAQGIGPPGQQVARVDTHPESIETLPPAADDIWQAPPTREPFRFRFSMRSLIITMTVAAVMLGMIRILGGPAPTATILGFIAVAGLIVHALGFEPPQSVVLGWWLILVLYVVLSIFGAMWAGLA